MGICATLTPEGGCPSDIALSLARRLSVRRRLNDVNKSHLWCVPGCLWYLMAALWFIVPTTFKFLLGVLIGILSVIAIIPTIVLLVYTLRASESK